MERPHEQDEHDQDREVTPPLKKKGNEKSVPTQKEDEDLLLKLGNDIVFGEVINRLPWYNRPILKTLSRSWADAITNYFPSYARLHRPRILSKLIVLFRTPFPNFLRNSSDDLALWVYSCHRPIMWNLPVPPIHVHHQEHVKFVCDDNDECVYSFTCVLEKGVYDVDVLDLREGSCSRWKRLPSLPACTDNYVYSCSSTPTVNGNGSTTYTICMRKAIEADAYAFSQWTLTSSEGKWKFHCVSSRPLFFAAEEKKAPFYVEIERHLDTHSPSLKCLFQRCERLDDSAPPALSWGYRYILMFQDDAAISVGYNFYEIRIYNDRVELYRMKVKESSSRIAVNDEGRRFWDFWQSRIYGFNLQNEGEERSAIKVSEQWIDMVGEGQGNDYVQVAQRSRSLYLYRLIGCAFDRMV